MVIMLWLISVVFKVTVLQIHIVVNVKKIYFFVFNVKQQSLESLILDLMFVFVNQDIIKIQVKSVSFVVLDVLLAQVLLTVLVVLLPPLQLMELEIVLVHQKLSIQQLLITLDIAQVVQTSVALVVAQ
jgi:hypothetical protein